MTAPTVDERARRDAIEELDISEDEFENNRKLIEGSFYYAKRRLYHAGTDLLRDIKGAIRND